MGYQDSIPYKVQKLRQHNIDRLRIHHHIIGDTRKLCNLKRNRNLGIDKGTEPLHNLSLFHAHRPDLNDLVLDRAEPCRFQIKDHIGAIKGLTPGTRSDLCQIIHQVCLHPVDDLKRIFFIKRLDKMIGIRERLHYSMICNSNSLMPPVVRPPNNVIHL